MLEDDEIAIGNVLSTNAHQDPDLCLASTPPRHSTQDLVWSIVRPKIVRLAVVSPSLSTLESNQSNPADKIQYMLCSLPCWHPCSYVDSHIALDDWSF